MSGYKICGQRDSIINKYSIKLIGENEQCRVVLCAAFILHTYNHVNLSGKSDPFYSFTVYMLRPDTQLDRL